MEQGVEYLVAKADEHFSPLGIIKDGKLYEASAKRRLLGELKDGRIEYEQGVWLTIDGMTAVDSRSGFRLDIFPRS